MDVTVNGKIVMFERDLCFFFFFCGLNKKGKKEKVIRMLWSKYQSDAVVQLCS